MPDSDEVRPASVDAIYAIDCSAAVELIAAFAPIQDPDELLVLKVDLVPATQASPTFAANLELPVYAVVEPDDRSPVARLLVPLLTARQPLVPSNSIQALLP